MRKTANVIQNIYRFLVIGCFLIIMTFLCAYNAASTAVLINWEHTAYIADSVKLNLVFVVLSVILVILVKRSGAYRFVCKKLEDDKIFGRCKAFLIIVILSLACLWALSTQFMPGVDEYAVQHAVVEVLDGNYESFAPLAYMDEYPNNWGFFLFSYLVACIFGKMNYIVIQLIIAVMIAVAFKALSEIAELFEIGRVGQLLVLFVGVIFIPFTFYSMEVYGNLPGVAFSLIAVKYEIKFLKDGGKIHHAVLSGVCIAIGVAFKSNMQIYFLAMLFTAVIYVFKSWKKALALVVILIAAYSVQSVGIALIIRSMTGCALDKPITSLAWVAMGLQDGDLAPGWWNNYSVKTYFECGGDAVKHSAVVKSSISDSLSNFVANPDYAVEFFTKKILSTWANPTFQCFATVRNGSYLDVPEWMLQLLSYKSQKSMTMYLNVEAFLVYFGSLLYVLTENFKRTYKLILPMTFVGGFLFYLVWEAKARYGLMFFIVLIPCAVKGFSGAASLISEKIKKLRSVDKGERKLNRKLVLRISAVAVSLVVFVSLYAFKFNAIFSQDTGEYLEYVKNSPDEEEVEYLGQADEDK